MIQSGAGKTAGAIKDINPILTFTGASLGGLEL
jgi:hypothetical protein